MPDDTARLVLTFDDGVAADAEQVAPVLDDAGVRATFAVVPSWVGTTGALDAEQVRGLDDAGNEIAAHGRQHRFLRSHGLRVSAAAGDTAVAVGAGRAYPGGRGGVLPGDAFELDDGMTTDVRTVRAVRDDGDGPVVVLDRPLSADYEPDETLARPAMSTVRDEVVGAATDLRAIGVTPTAFVLPYCAVDTRTWRVVEAAYDRLLDAWVQPIPNPAGHDRATLGRFYIETDRATRVEIEEYLDAVAARGAVGVAAGHASRDTLPPSRVSFVVDAALERGIEVAPLAPDG